MACEKSESKVSIVVLTHNARQNCEILLGTLTMTQGVQYELVVVDNNSEADTRSYLWSQFEAGKINRICFLERNTLFAEGNNIGVAASSRATTHVLLLNSDVEIRQPLW